MADNISFSIEAQNKSVTAIGQAVQQTRQLADEIRALKKAGDQTVDGQAKLGTAILEHARKQAQLKQALQQTAQESVRLNGALRGMADGISAQAGPLGGILRSLTAVNLGVALAAGAFVGLGIAAVSATKGLADYQEQADLAAASTGFTTNEIAGLRVAASETGRSFEQIRPALDFFSRRIGEAASGNKDAQQTFHDLGVAIKDASGQILPVGQVFRQVQDRLNELAPGAERSRFAFEVFGRGAGASLGALLTPLDQATDRAERLGIALGPEAEAQARAADVAFDSLKLSIQGITNAFAVAAATGIVPFLNNLAKLSAEIAEFVNSPAVKILFAGLGGPKGFQDWAIEQSKPLMAEGAPLTAFKGDISGTKSVDALTTMADAAAKAAKEWKAAAAAMREAAEFEAFMANKFGTHGGGISKPTFQDFSGISDMAKFDARNRAVANLRPMEVPEIDLFRGMVGDFQDAISGLDVAFSEATVAALHFNDALVSGFTKSVHDSVLAVLNGGNLIETAWKGMLDTLKNAVASYAADIAEPFIKKGVGSILGFLFQSGGTLVPVHAQAGLVNSGYRGHDTVPVLLGRGESVISHATTDKLAAFLDSFARGAPTQSQASRGGDIHLAVTFQGGGGQMDEQGFRDRATDYIVRQIEKAQRSGRIR